MSMNKVMLLGNVGKDPDVRYLENGVAKCSFSLATSESYTNKAGEKVTTTEWHNVVAWRDLAKAAEGVVKKGMQLYVEGKISTRSYTDKEGTQKRITEITADTIQIPIQMLGRKPESQSFPEGENKAKADSSPAQELEKDADDLPF
jgi:single-strand DNA-binding protein